MTSRRCLWLRLKSWESQSWESFSGAIDCTARVSRNISKGTLEIKSGWDPVTLEFQQKHTNAIWCNLWAHFWLQHLTSEPWQNQARHLYKSCTSLYTLHIGEKYDTTSCDALARHQLHLHLRTPATQHFHITMWRVTLHGQRHPGPGCTSHRTERAPRKGQRSKQQLEGHVTTVFSLHLEVTVCQGMPVYWITQDKYTVFDALTGNWCAIIPKSHVVLFFVFFQV